MSRIVYTCMKARASYNNISMLQNTCTNKKNHSTAIKLEDLP